MFYIASFIESLFSFVDELVIIELDSEFHIVFIE